MEVHDSGDGNQIRGTENEGKDAAGDSARASSSSRSSCSCKAAASPSGAATPALTAADSGSGSGSGAAASTSALCWPARPRRLGGFVWRADLLDLLRCPRCQQSPLAPPVRLCANGHSLCHSCYQDLSTQTEVCCNCHEEINEDNCFLDWSDGECCHEECGAEPPGCVVCGEPVREARNLLAEQLCLLLADGAPRGTAMRPSASTATLASSVSVATSRPDSVNDDASRCESASGCSASSHRPLRCPREPCRRLVAVTALLSHFRFQHPDVPVANTVRGAETTLALLPATVPLEMATCVALLLVHRTSRSGHGSRSVVPLPVLTSRTRLMGGAAPQATAGDGESVVGAALLVWLCDVEGGGCTYSATACRGALGASFRGPVASLRHPQTPAAALQSHGCLCLPPGLLSALTDAGALPAHISFIVY